MPACPFSLWFFVLLKAVACDGLKSVAVCAWNGLDRYGVAPWALLMAPLMLIGLQFVGLNVKPGPSIVTLTCWICRGTPSMICGIASAWTVTCAVYGSILIAAP